ncbi:hypothetical protein [Methanomethylovorans sp.]|uniref:hypothetical protein n=1 Tax=Methanomethylovorans sp. TaxID=2758717 RepID=UPI000AA52021|nr:hypothetical protein [Methanomethylovorans sp.]
MKRISDLLQNERAWVDFVLSKTALILASVVVIAAIYHFAVTMNEVSQQRELDMLSTELLTYIDKVGSSPDEVNVTYTFNKERFSNYQKQRTTIFISGEYIVINADIDGRCIISAKAPAFRVYPYSPSVLCDDLRSEYGSSGNITEPIRAEHADVIGYLTARTGEVSIDTSDQVHIQKIFIYFVDDLNVEKIGYVLVYQ